MVAQSLKKQSIICSLIGVLTLFIWNLVVGIRLFAHRNEFEDSTMAAITGFAQILLGGGLIFGLIFSCLLKPKA